MTDPRDLTRALGGRWFGSYGTAPCPVCQPERRRDQDALSISTGTDGRLLLKCHKSGCAFRDILAAAGFAPGAPSRPDPEAEARRKAELAAQRRRREGAAWRIWQEARPARGTLAEAYLRGRHLALPERAPIRFHPSAPHPSGALFPAMVARIDGGEGFAVHCTYLSEPGRKAAATPAKATFGLPKGGAVRLIEPPEGGPLLIGEGIETTLAAVALYGAPAGGWAALSAVGMQTLDLAHIPAGAAIVALGDGDGAGRAAMRHLAARAHAAGFTAKMLPAPEGRDWADVLHLAASRTAKGGAA
ncbi:MAG: hypothetical protein KatS3mg118_3005 [Paracoccaceae bacterium]|nr:MAG: hypothetical protein KatS3mg118_0775 [Paracoccaceae bacterium]GIX14670.1 MAG: hypothetical protein KatS3mg118_2629 [Paracoccaceae bacterium]GIX15046.1 MAG: hypothetical protein KatS3mg118_3005 [Paracoccaceae bacterium]